MKNYPLLDSAAQAKIYGYFSLVDEIRSVEGDVVEAGVGRGFSLAALAYAVSYFKLDKVIYGFDSFTGFPPATENDLGSRVSEAGKVPEGWSDTSPELVASIFEYDRSKISSLLREHDVQLEIVPGFFEDTLPDLLPSQIAFLHVDSDLYDSIKVVLERCLPRLSSGGIVIVDEYHDERWPGAKKATDEIFKRLGLNIEYFDVIRRYGVRVP